MKKEMKNRFLLITYGVVLFVLLSNYTWVFNFLSILWKILLPFVIGGVIAFVLNIIVNSLEKRLLHKLKYGKRILSVIMSLLMVIGFVVILLFILIPQIKNAGMIFIQNIPEYQENIYELGTTLGLTEKQMEFMEIDVEKIVNGVTTLITENSQILIDASFGVVNSVVSGVTNFFVGLVFAIYVLLDKESLCRQIKKLLKRISTDKFYDKTLKISSLSQTTFTNFVKVQCLEACILGGLCFVGMLIFGFPYAGTISVLVGFTALIPIFGAFIGCVLGAFLIFMINPVEAILFIVFFLILQQIEGNFIYPRVVGGKIGLPSIWVLVAVMIGGSVGGLFGMLLGVPIVSILYTLLKEFVNTKKPLKQRVLETIEETIN